jgi:hypothetical protein
MNGHTRFFRGAVVAFLVCAAGPFPVWGQRMIAVTQARNALGEAARLYAHSLDFKTGAPLPGVQVLPGTALIAPLVQDPAYQSVLASTGRAWTGTEFEARHRESALSGFRTAPFDRWPGADLESAPGWRERAVAVVQDDRTLSQLLVTAAMQPAGGGKWGGRVAARPWPPGGIPGRVQAPGGETRLAIAPRLAVPVRSGIVLAFGGAEADGPALVQRVDVVAGTAEAPVPFPGGGRAPEGRDLAAAVLSPDGATVWVLCSSLSGAAPASRLYALDTASLTARAPPLELPGIAGAAGRALAAGGAGYCWAATRTPGTDFGQITRATLAEAPGGGRKPVQDRSHAIVGVQQSLALTEQPETGDLLVAIGRRLEYWPAGERTGAGHNYDAPVTTVRWTDRGPVVGEGNRLHRIALPGCAPVATIALQSGWVLDAVWAPEDALPAPDADADGLDDATERRMQTDPYNPDTDGDGIPDGSDPHPTVPSPWLEVAAEVVFPYKAVGRQLRALRIESHNAPDAQWQVHVDAGELPWLRVHPRTFRGSGHAYMGVDPEHFDPGGVVSGTIEVTLSGRSRGNRPGYTAAYSPATVHVRVEPPRDPVPAILWLWPGSAGEASLRDPADPRDLRALGNLAGGYPYYFSMVERFGPVSEPLNRFSVVVVTARAAAEGVLTQKALFDYLSTGGAVLFLGEHLEGEHFRDLGAWLAPLDVHVTMEAPVNGRYDSGNATDLLRHWQNFMIENGCGLATEPAGDQHVPSGDGGQVFVARTHGYGRIALLSAATPLETRALETPANRDFALDLLYWLSRAGYAIEDIDGDGIPDGVEDRNNNGIVDPGETDWLNPDTDGDGIPDGMEDTNRNGVVDAGETDPRNPDTDGDGVYDGADASPVG